MELVLGHGPDRCDQDVLKHHCTCGAMVARAAWVRHLIYQHFDYLVGHDASKSQLRSCWSEYKAHGKVIKLAQQRLKRQQAEVTRARALRKLFERSEAPAVTHHASARALNASICKHLLDVRASPRKCKLCSESDFNQSFSRHLIQQHRLVVEDEVNRGHVKLDSSHQQVLNKARRRGAESDGREVAAKRRRSQ